MIALRHAFPEVLQNRGGCPQIECSNLFSFPNIDWLRKILLVSADQQGSMRKCKLSRPMAEKRMSNDLRMLYFLPALSCISYMLSAGKTVYLGPGTIPHSLQYAVRSFLYHSLVFRIRFSRYGTTLLPSTDKGSLSQRLRALCQD